MDIFLGFMSLALALVGIVLTMRSRQRKVIKCEVESTPLITNKMSSIPGLKITMHDSPIRSLTSSKITLTNLGNESIQPSDFAPLAQLGAVVTGKLFSTEQTCQITSDNGNFNPRIKIGDDASANIEFDYISPKKSFSIKLLHDGELSVRGELKSGKLLSPDDCKKGESRKKIINYVLVLVEIILFLLLSTMISTSSISPLFNFLGLS